MKHYLVSFLLLCGGLLLATPGCSTRTSLSKDSVRATRVIFARQAKRRTSMSVQPLAAAESKGIWADYMGKKRARRTQRRRVSSTSMNNRPVQTTRLGGARRYD
ncbi:MAG: hypothetical protein VX589_07060 [Myxococcota bacterium]|nr:hypothetical protein [Myxococcota bacterium]